MRTFKIIGVFGVLAFVGQVAACAPGAEDAKSSQAEVTTLIPGASLHSPNANPAATYLPGRSIANLDRLGALAAPLDELASRVDGTLGSAAADGRITIDELLALEKSGTLEQLLPAERAALPALWKLLETVTDAPSEVTVPAIDAILATEVSDVATTPIEPANIALASLNSQLKRAASHLEQAHDSDNDPSTITQADITAALASPAGFQVGEIAQLKTIQSIFRDRAGTKLAAKVRVTPPVPVSYATPPPVVTWGPATLGIAKTIEYNESRTMDVAKGDLVVSLVGHVTQHALITVPTGNDILFIDDGADTESFHVSGVLEGDAGVKTVEVWNTGVRVGSYRVKLPRLEALETNIDLSKYADYAFVLPAVGDAAPVVLDRKPVSNSGTQTGDGASSIFNCGFSIAKDNYGFVSDQILAGVATPAFHTASGRYVLPTADGDLTVELYPEGIFSVSRASGWTERAIFRGNRYVLPAGADLHLSYDPSTNTITVSRPDETVIFSGTLSGSLRTG